MDLRRVLEQRVNEEEVESYAIRERGKEGELGYTHTPFTLTHTLRSCGEWLP